MPAEKGAPPNIVVVMSDDHARWALGCEGSASIQSPNIDWLAANGVSMARAFTPSPVCSPARACFFTGRLPSQHGIHDWILEDTASDYDWLAGEVTLAQLLQSAGYETGLVGKWHCGRSDRRQPGFDYWFSHEYSQYPHLGSQRFTEQDTTVRYFGYQSTFLTGKAVEFLRRRDRSRPFFLFVGYVDTHSPFADHPTRLVDRYRDCDFSDIPADRYHGPGWPRFSAPTQADERRALVAQYAAAVTHIDEQVGVLVDELEGTGESENTLVVYTSDHGHMNGHHGLYTKGNATVPQNFYEESIRVPCVLRLPGTTVSGLKPPEMVDHCDLFQTLLDAAGATPTALVAAERCYPGRSYLPILRGERSAETWRAAQFCEYGNARMVRTERWKYILRYPINSGSHNSPGASGCHSDEYGCELYDLMTDPGEIVNRVDAEAWAPVCASLEQQLETYFERYEQREHSGREIMTQRQANPHEPWRLRRSK